MKLRADVTARYHAARPHGSPKAFQLDALTAMVDTLARQYAAAGRHPSRRVRRSIPQLVRALELAGVETRAGADAWRREASVKETRQRFRKTVGMRLDTLIELGYVESWAPVYGRDGRGAGIVVVLAADVAQLAAAPLSRRRPRRPGDRPASSGFSSASTRRAASISGATPPPPTGINSVDTAWSAAKAPNVERGSASARGASVYSIERREQAALQDRARTALGARQAAGLGRDGSATAAALPWLALVDVVALARVLLGLYRPELTPKLSARSERRLRAAVPRLDRYANHGAGGQGVGLALLIDYCADPEPPWDGARPAESLGAIAKSLDRLSKEWRRHDRRRGQR